MDTAAAKALVAALTGGGATAPRSKGRRASTGGGTTGRRKARSKGRRKGKKYSGCSIKSSYTIRSGEDAGLVVNEDCYSIWMKLRGQPLITGVGTPHKKGAVTKSQKGNEWVKYCFEMSTSTTKELTTGFVNPRTKTVHLPYYGVGYIASPSFGKTAGGACFHPTGKKK